MALQSSQRLPELLFYMKKSYRILQLQFYKGTHPSTYNLHVHITLHNTSREFSIQNPILHAEDKELFEYYYYIQRAKRPSFQKRNSTVRLVSTENSTEYQLGNYKYYILQRKGDVAISVRIDIFSRIELFPSNVLSSEKTNYKNDIQ